MRFNQRTESSPHSALLIDEGRGEERIPRRRGQHNHRKNSRRESLLTHRSFPPTLRRRRQEQHHRSARIYGGETARNRIRDRGREADVCGGVETESGAVNRQSRYPKRNGVQLTVE